MEHASVAACYEEFNSLQNELNGLDEQHKEYVQKVNELTKLQQNCWKGINHQRYRMKAIEKSLKLLDAKNSNDEEERRSFYKMKKELIKREIRLNDMDDYLPRKSGRYLNIILGSVNVSLLTKADRYTYKDEYEKFKVIVTVIALFCSFMSLVVLRFRVMDSIIMFLLVWYYCTLTIRESILKVNGSKIKGWWRTHHFLSTVAAGVLLTWPDSRTYHEFRDQFLLFNVYIAVVQLLQFRYQQGCLYRLKALGERHNMDITIEGFHSWMWRGLSFLLPFLYLGYMFQLYNAYVLYYMTMEDYCKEWQVPILSVMFFALFLGNIITTSMVIPQKLKEKLTLKYRFPRFRKNGMKEQSTQTGSPPNSADEAEPELDSHDKKAL